MIIPFFIPHSGCPHQCVFCNQKNITGRTTPVDPDSIPRTISDYSSSNTKNKPIQVAFYGGSFTALPQKTQRAYLEAVQPFIRTGQIESIRLSTRPDCINNDTLLLLKDHHVTIVELGVQSMIDSVLLRAGRGHTAADTMNAVKLLKEHGFTIGLQLMLGLPGDSVEYFVESVDRIIGLKPDFVRIYPTLVIKGTPLEHLWDKGDYIPLSLDEAVAQCREALERFEQAGVDIIRIGLQPTEELETPGTILAGPYHPSFRELVESSLFLDRMRTTLREQSPKAGIITFQVHPADLSAAIGQHRANVKILTKEFGLQEIHIKAGNTIQRKSAPSLLLSS
jgi:histone acetyltransferase (RNA polymerase elongator complex component)